MTDERRARLWAKNNLYVDAVLRPDGSLVFRGQDLTSPNMWGTGEYEYALTVAPADVPRVVAALGGSAADDVLALVEANGERIVTTGEQRWLRGAGVDPQFWSRVGD
ncbi:hypothetical protein [Spirilliplanes yamanashiensis]|uniref:Uncharacterized protein n=1 Tax=Spirilliplanes yamanashiensis TaxID=42233 RepID=A0A8J3Y3L7_9ACTN|nr:hypothetical protein [Spirilliplanes yamanashiensis]MDP9814244.1 hypothetical protein [Spirilliplanes yamanashiensis]GIJ00773.1 hypothetical protein Sya03_01250 [Spirilliplanes yamanashiensis]